MSTGLHSFVVFLVIPVWITSRTMKTKNTFRYLHEAKLNPISATIRLAIQWHPCRVGNLELRNQLNCCDRSVSPKRLCMNWRQRSRKCHECVQFPLAWRLANGSEQILVVCCVPRLCRSLFAGNLRSLRKLGAQTNRSVIEFNGP